MKFASVRRIAMALPEVTEQPHFEYGSFRVRGKIFVTMPPDEKHIHVFVTGEDREQALAMYADFVEPLLWGGKIAGVRVVLASASPTIVKQLVRRAWATKAPKTLVAKARSQ
ncbi:MAG: MmcQ/YjbR family DNA-binding protein [Planctomycetota bacterium]